MRRRVTVSISDDALRHVDRLAGARGRARSQMIDSFIEESRRRKKGRGPDSGGERVFRKGDDAGGGRRARRLAQDERRGAEA